MFVRTIVGAVVLVGFVAGSLGCGSAPPEPSGSSDGVYSVQLTAATLATLPQCTWALAGTVAYVTSPSSLWACSLGAWHEIKCSASNAGSVAYAGSTTLLACVASSWIQIALPKGPPGDPGAQGPQG